jgi:hypothetical protein
VTKLGSIGAENTVEFSEAYSRLQFSYFEFSQALTIKKKRGRET